MDGLNELAKQIHEIAKKKGFWDKPREKGTLLMLIVSELVEALEADRHSRFADWSGINKLEVDECDWENSPISFEHYFTKDVKDTFEDEIADTFIRLFDLCGAMEIDIERHIKHKIVYNSRRKHMHGKNY